MKYFIEIKNRLFLLIFSYIVINMVIYYHKSILLILIIINNVKLANDILHYFIFTSITELFMIYVNINFFVTSQIFYFSFFYQLTCFLASGLYKIEYEYLKITYSFCIIFALISFVFFNEIIVPLLSEFFLNFQQKSFYGVNLYFEPKINQYLDFYKETYYRCFFGFQFCVLIILLASQLSKKISMLKPIRKSFYLILLFFSTVLTPPDWISQIFLFMILTLFFELLIIINIFKMILQKLIR